MCKRPLQVGDRVITVAEYDPDYEFVRTIVVVENGIAYSDYEHKIGYWAESYAGRLAKKDDPPYVRLLTPLEEVLR